MEDNRILWLKCSIANMLGVYEPEYVNAAIYENLYDFKSFLNDKYTKNEDINKIILYVWRTFYDKLVEEEITVLEEVPPELPPETEKKDKKSKKGKGKVMTKEKDVKSNVKSAIEKEPKGGRPSSMGKIKSSDAERNSTKEATDTGIESATEDVGAESVKSSALSASDEDDDEIGSKKSGKGKGKRKKRKTLVAPSPVYVEVKKIIPTFVKTPILHCHFGELKCSHFNNNIKYVYVIRKEVSGIPFYTDINKCFAEMSQYFIFGTVRGSLLDSMRIDIDKIFKHAIKFQFREPKLIESEQFENCETHPLSKSRNAADSTEVKEMAPGLLELSKPSEFRMKALKQKKYVNI
ncbi:hypothetical protein CVS40_6160 [Lucilia cuprina]|nr:hypothetical protein CVS40_6160 [Lucilia cuprina]KAI8123157.1 hypothetical protein CVS40_6160 [Lucilia cuprina]